MNSGIILSVVAVFTVLAASNALPKPDYWEDFGTSLSEQINRQVQQGLSGLKDLDRLKNLGSEITENVHRQVNNQMWFRGPNVCITEMNEENANGESFNSIRRFGNHISQSCIGMNEQYTCTITDYVDGQIQRKTVIYKCCENYSLGRDGEQIRCLKNDY
uniref:16 kDa salivary protein B n=1 Tax=Phlebotomus arabicus TaxID=578135 RepID=C6G3X7_9DIPT